METKKISIKGKELEFETQILLKHLRKIEPLSTKLNNKDIGGLDFMVELAKILVVSTNPWEVEDLINSLNFEEFQAFSKDFEDILQSFKTLTEDKKK